MSKEIKLIKVRERQPRELGLSSGATKMFWSLVYMVTVSSLATM